jgi:hypothetical protein
MFERYTEKARRAIFFARYEASQNGSPFIDTMHLLLGILHESKVLFSEAGLQVSVAHLSEDCRKALPPAHKMIPTNVDLPLSNECKQALEAASAEADRLGSESVGWQHLMLGLIKASGDIASLLHRHGITEETLAMPSSGQGRQGMPGTVMLQSGLLRPTVEFFCQGERIASTLGFSAVALPRVGDEVVFPGPDGPHIYEVLSVRFHFEERPAGSGAGHLWPARVTVETQKRT